MLPLGIVPCQAFSSDLHYATHSSGRTSRPAAVEAVTPSLATRMTIYTQDFTLSSLFLDFFGGVFFLRFFQGRKLKGCFAALGMTVGKLRGRFSRERDQHDN
jgi:hypothetical protein